LMFLTPGSSSPSVGVVKWSHANNSIVQPLHMVPLVYFHPSLKLG
jgi:hypothetical protein